MADFKMDFVTTARQTAAAATAATAATAVPASRKRQPTEAGRQLPAAARGLQRFFASQSEMAQALDTTRDTLRVWLSDGPPARPRVELVERVLLMETLGENARPFLADDRQVGAWLLAPQPTLHGSSPAALVRQAGQDAVELLTAQIVALAPTVPSQPVSIASVTELRARMAEVLDDDTMARLDARAERRRANRPTEAEIQAQVEAALAADDN